MNYAHSCLVRKQNSSLQFVVIYVNSMNLIDTLEETKKTTKHLKSEFEMKDFRRPNHFLDLESCKVQIEFWSINQITSRRF